MDAIKSKEANGVLFLSFASDKLLDDLVIQQSGDELMEAISQAQQGQKVILSFKGVSFMSSAMLGRLVVFLKKCKQAGVELRVCSIDPTILEVFKITKLNKLFDIRKSEQEALESFDKKGWFG